MCAATTSSPNKKKQKRDTNNNNNNKEKQRQHGPLIERYGFGKGFATMQQSASTSKRNKTTPELRTNGEHGPLISHHGFGKGFASITDAPSQPASGPSLHQTTLPATYLSQAAVKLEAEGIIKQRFLEQPPPDAEPTIIRGTSNQHL